MSKVNEAFAREVTDLSNQIGLLTVGHTHAAITLALANVFARTLMPLSAKTRAVVLAQLPDIIHNNIRMREQRAQDAREQPATSDGQTPPSPAGRGGKN